MCGFLFISLCIFCAVQALLLFLAEHKVKVILQIFCNVSYNGCMYVDSVMPLSLYSSCFTHTQELSAPVHGRNFDVCSIHLKCLGSVPVDIVKQAAFVLVPFNSQYRRLPTRFFLPALSCQCILSIIYTYQRRIA